MSYDHIEIEARWQLRWREAGVHKTTFNPQRPKFYALDMFPYPSGAGLHVGHCEGYTATDIVTRCKRMQGWNVLHPMGWDAFGLPAENYAIRTGVHPRTTTAEAIATFRRQIESLGLAYDWSREVNTTDPAYFKWTQWIFLQLMQGAGARGGHPHQLVPLLQRAWRTKKSLQANANGAARRSSARICASGCSGSRPMPTGCWRIWTRSTGPPPRCKCRRTGSAGPKVRRSISSWRMGPRPARYCACLPRGRIRFSAPPTW